MRHDDQIIYENVTPIRRTSAPLPLQNHPPRSVGAQLYSLHHEVDDLHQTAGHLRTEVTIHRLVLGGLLGVLFARSGFWPLPEVYGVVMAHLTWAIVATVVGMAMVIMPFVLLGGLTKGLDETGGLNVDS